jgi:hypothetical protein
MLAVPSKLYCIVTVAPVKAAGNLTPAKAIPLVSITSLAVSPDAIVAVFAYVLLIFS